MADQKLTLDDIQAAQDASPEVSVEQLPVTRPQPVAAPEDPNAPGFIKTVAREDFFAYGAARVAAEAGMDFNPNFDLGKDVPEKEWDEATAGLSDDAKQNIANAAKSRSHMYFLIDLANESQKADEKLSTYGGWGIAGRLGVDLFDPINFLGGVGVANKAARLEQGIKLAKTAAEFRNVATEAEAAVNAGHRAILGKAAVHGAVENAILQGTVDAGDPNRDGWDLLYGTMGAAVMSPALGRLFSGSELSKLRKIAGLAKNQALTVETREAIEATRASLHNALGDAEAARAQLQGLSGRTASFIAARETDLSGYANFRHALESGGDPNAYNPAGHALGIDQFVPKTWLGIVKQQKPAWAEGLTDDALLALRKDPAKSAEMVAALDKQNEAALRKAGAPVNPFTMYAAHFFGPNKAVRFAKASEDTLMDHLLTEAQLAANPKLRGKTKGEMLAQWAERARQGGADLADAVDRTGFTPEEALRHDQMRNFDPADARSRVAELEQQLQDHEAALAQHQQDAQALLPQGEARKLQREVDDIQSELSGHKGKPTAKLAARIADLEQQIADVKAGREGQLKAMHAEDSLKMGPEIAGNKQRTKLREGVVDKRIATQTKQLEKLLGTAKHEHGRARYALKERLRPASQKLAAHTKAVAARDALKTLQGDTSHAARAAEVDSLKAALGLNDRVGQDAQKLLDAKGALTTEHKALAPTADHLKKLDALDGLQSANDIRAEQLATKGEAAKFGPDTLSAARVVGFDEGLFPHATETSSGQQIGRMKFGEILKVYGKGTFAGVLRGSENDVVRNELGVLVGNSLGNVDNTANHVGASEVASHFQKTMVGKFHATVTPAYDAWMKEKGIWSGRQWNRKVRATFMNELGLHIRGTESESAAIKAAGERIRSHFAEFVKEAKEAGVKGFENVDTNDFYLPRAFDHHSAYTLSEQVGWDGITTLIEHGIRNANPDIPEEISRKIAPAYVKRMRELRMGMDANLMQGMSWDDIPFLRQFLGEAGMDSHEIEDIASKFAEIKARTKPSEGEGNFRHAKRRVQFDENFSMPLLKKGRIDASNPDNLVEVKIAHLLENNVESLYGRYSRTMSGHIGLAKVGIKSRADFQLRMERVANALEGDKGEWESVKKYAEGAYKLITAQPLEDSDMWSELMRTGRDLAYATQMENAGLANVPDLASLLAAGNLRYTAKAFFSGDVFRAIWKRNADGRMADEFMREIEETTGIGTDFLNNAIHSSYDLGEEYTQELVGGKWLPQKITSGFSAVAHGARVTSRAVTAGSGMAAINSLGQRLAARNIIYRMKDELFKGGGFSKARMAVLGIDDGMKSRIEAQMRKHTEWTKGEMGGDIQRVNFHAWDDLDARDAFLYAVHREAKRNIQEEDLGDTFFHQHKGMGKVLTQFRRFAITAFTKQTLRGIADHDAEAATRAAMQSVLAAGVYMAKQQMVISGMEAAGTDADKIDKWKQNNAGWDKVAAAAIRNSGWAALMPDLYDSTVGYAFGTPLFNVRNSGNTTFGLNQIPVATLMSNIGGAATGTWQAMIRNDRQFDQKDLKAWQGLIPFGNHLLVAPLFEALTQDLPTGDTDPDPNSADFGITN